MYGSKMERKIDQQLEDLRHLILLMGGHVEKALGEAMMALIQRDSARFLQVHEIEKMINQAHVRVDEACAQLLAKQGPVARDLRFIISVIKINADLERMGDQSVNIAYTGKDYLERMTTLSLHKIERMAEVTRGMVKQSLDAFVRLNVDEAKQVLISDDEVDDLKRQVFHDCKDFIKLNPQHVESALDLILIARNLERLGDHATNIAEDVIYVSTGKDIRHGGKYSSTGS
jgi:phosphate transport system protein